MIGLPGSVRVCPFDDYAEYVDGEPRYDGVRSFLSARGTELPEGESGDPPEAETLRRLGNRKSALVMQMIREGGVEVYEGSVSYLEAARDAGQAEALREHGPSIVVSNFSKLLEDR